MPTEAIGGHLEKISASGPMPTSRYWLHQPFSTSAAFTAAASALPGRNCGEVVADDGPHLAPHRLRLEASPRQRSSMTRSSMERT